MCQKSEVSWYMWLGLLISSNFGAYHVGGGDELSYSGSEGSSKQVPWLRRRFQWILVLLPEIVTWRRVASTVFKSNLARFESFIHYFRLEVTSISHSYFVITFIKQEYIVINNY